MTIDWGKIGTNVLNSIAIKLPEIGLSALATAIAPKVEAARRAAAQPAAKPAAAPELSLVTSPGATTPVWQKYLPYGIGGAVLLGAVYMFTQRR